MKKFTWVLAIAAIVGLSAPELDASRAKHHHNGRQHAQGKNSKKAPVRNATNARKPGKVDTAYRGAGKPASQARKVHPIAKRDQGRHLGASKAGKRDQGRHLGASKAGKRDQGRHLGVKGAQPANR